MTKRNKLTEQDLQSVTTAVESAIQTKLYERTKMSYRKISEIASHVAVSIPDLLVRAAGENGVTIEEEKQ